MNETNGNGVRQRQIPRRRWAIDSVRFMERLRQIVRAAGGPKEVAYHADISLSALYNYMNGRIPLFDIVARLANYAGVPTDWFIVDDERAAGMVPRVGTMSYADGNCPELGNIKLTEHTTAAGNA